ncbi:hypothetical protein HPC37_07420 [Pasteurellaceae bacterium 20609_3]|nr:hypothetical protein [Spirabiliibacterium mucosae]
MPNHHRTFAKIPHWWLFGGCYLKVTFAKRHNSHQQQQPPRNNSFFLFISKD